MLGCAIVLVITVALFVYSPRLAFAVGAIGIVALLGVDFLGRKFAKPRTRSRAEVVETLESVVDGSCAEIDWHDFLRYRIEDEALEDVRLRCVRLEGDHPARAPERLLSAAGKDVLREMIAELDRA